MPVVRCRAGCQRAAWLNCTAVAEGPDRNDHESCERTCLASKSADWSACVQAATDCTTLTACR